jgi:hypothetical protein
MHSDALAEGIAELGDVYKPLGVILDRIASVVPGATIMGVVMLVGMQIAENHGKLNAQARDMSPVPVLSKEELAQMIMDEARKAADNGATVPAA